MRTRPTPKTTPSHDTGGSGAFYELGASDCWSAEAGAEASAGRIGRYEVIGVLGVGGMGIVYEARDAGRPRRSVAVKVLRSAASDRARRRFEIEAEALGRLQHPGIAAFYESGWHDAGDGAGPRPFLVMELVRGSPITRFARDGALPVRERIELFLSLCDAVEHAHQRGVIHRDLKPGNILVTGEGHVKTLDFGVARCVDGGDGELGRATMSGEVLGTLRYMSPEQIEGDRRSVDTRSDVFSLGVVLYELLTGRLPHDAAAGSVFRVAQAIRDDPPARLGAVSRAFRGDLETIVGAALEKSAQRRYQSIGALAEDLRRHLSSRPINARPPSAVDHVVKFARRHKALVAGVAAAAVAASVFGALLVRSAHRNAQHAAQMRTTLDHLVDGVLGELQELSGANAARDGLGAILLERFEALPSEANDERMIRKHVEVLHALSAVALDRGDAARAIGLRTRAVDLLAPLQGARPNSRETTDEYAVARILLGDAFKDADRRDEALVVYQAVHDSLLERLASNPDDNGLRDDLCWSYERLSAIVQPQRPDLAIEYARERGRLARELYEAGPDDIARIFNLGCAEAASATLALQFGDPTAALAHAEAAVRMASIAADSDPPRFAYHTRQLMASNVLTRALHACGEPGAFGAAMDALELARVIAAANPDSSHARSMLRATLRQAARISTEFGQSELAAIFERELLDLARDAA